MAGAFALILAGFGSAVIGDNADSGTLRADNYQTISETYVGGDGASADSQVDVSRNFDRNLDKQAEAQATQLKKALASLTKKTQARSNAVKKEKNQWVLPVAGYRLTATFGQQSGLWARGHTGLDFAGPSGSTIIAISGGVVKSAGYEGSYGNRTVISLDDGTDIWYAHQSRIVVTPGQRVTPGEVVGYTGSTGNVTGPHLHLEVHPGGGAAVDPFPVLVEHGVRP